METLIQNDISFLADPWPPAAARPTLIFFHGAAMSKTFWQPQIESLAGLCNTLAPDLPGHGDSPGSGFDTIAAYTDRIIAWLDDLAAPRPIPCGLSMGGAVCLDLLLRHAERFAAGILINTGARLRVMPPIFESIQNNFEDFKNMLTMAAVAAPNQTKEMSDLVRSQIRCTAETAHGDFTACNAFDVMDRITGIDVPVLVISGNDDTTTPPKYAAFLADQIPGARLEKIDQAAHLAPLEQPAAVNAAMAEFLKQL
ncbi:MAG: alpha/beta fold hydrolase [Desulfosudaceae bacterium]